MKMDFTLYRLLMSCRLLDYFLFSINSDFIFSLRHLFDISPFNMLLRVFVKFLLKVIHLFPISGYA